MMGSLKRSVLAFLRRQGGQAMVEYSAVAFMLAGGGGALLITFFMPTMYTAFNMYLHGFQIIFQLPIP